MADFDQLSRTGLFAQEAIGEAPAAERLAQLREEPLLIALSPGMGFRGQMVLAAVVNIVGRLFEFLGPVDLRVPAQNALPGIFELRPRVGLARAAARLMRNVREIPREADVAHHAKRGPYRRGIVIGAQLQGDIDEPVYIDACGWVASVGPVASALAPQRDGAFNPFGCLVAAALGSAELAKGLFRALDDSAERERFAPFPSTVVWDLWSHGDDAQSKGPALPPDLDLGDAAIAGLGALGSAAVYALAHVEGAVGSLELVDTDTLSVTNLERVLTATGEHVGWSKTGLARRALRETGLESHVIRDQYGAEPPAAARASTLLVGVDSGDSRRAIARYLPEAVYNGGTQGSEILVSRHVRFDGACLECLYPQTLDPIGRTARRLGVDRATAAALEAGERKIDSEVLASLQRRGGVHFEGVDINALLGEPLSALDGYECSRAIVIEDLPEATIGFVAALCGFLMACEFAKDRIDPARKTHLDASHPAYRLDLLEGSPREGCVESYVPRRDCFCAEPATRERIAELKRGPR